MLSQRLRDLLGSRGITLNEFSIMCDLPIETVRNVYYGKTNDPKISTVLKMSAALQISVNCLMGQCQYTKEEKLILSNYRRCGNHGKSMIEMVSKYEAHATVTEKEKTDKYRIPCLISAGDIHYGINYDNCTTEEVETTSKEAYMAVKMTTNDMLPVYCKGDIVLIENRFPRDKEYAMFCQNGVAYIRQFLEDERCYRLHCIHNRFDDIVLKRMDELDYVGTCIGVIRTR